MDPAGTSSGMSLRRRVHVALDSADIGGRVTRWTHTVIVLLILVSVAAMVFESVPHFADNWKPLLRAIEIVALVGFTIEFLLRIWSAPEATPYLELHPAQARWEYIRSPMAVIDFLSIAPLYLTFFEPVDLRALLLLRLLRFFKLARYSPGMRSLVAALEAERKALLASAVILVGVVLLAASAIHIVEGEAQPDKFGTIPDSMWWAIVTLTTVGYGDVVPVTIAGKLISSVTMIMGLMMLALPVGIIATAFADEIHRREFVVTWGMVARVPLFEGMPASQIAEIMRYLRAQTVPTGALITRRGDTAHCLYFISSGEVELEGGREPMRLGEGEFFGEMALLRHSARIFTARATAPTKLLLLDASDFFILLDRNPNIRAHVEKIAAERDD